MLGKVGPKVMKKLIHTLTRERDTHEFRLTSKSAEFAFMAGRKSTMIYHRNHKTVGLINKHKVRCLTAKSTCISSISFRQLVYWTAWLAVNSI